MRLKGGKYSRTFESGVFSRMGVGEIRVFPCRWPHDEKTESSCRGRVFFWKLAHVADKVVALTCDNGHFWVLRKA